MEMKKIVLAMMGVTLLGVATSCTDFLDEKTRSEISSGQNFTAPAHARTAVNKLYRCGAPELYGNGGVYMPSSSTMGGYISGFFDNEYKGQEIIAAHSQALTISSKNIAGSMDGVWDKCYESISRANTAIKYIPSTPGLTDTEKDNLMAQAKFFRAFDYFFLVKFFGDVPLITEPCESLDDLLYVARTASAQVYAQIIDDLTFAASKLNDVAFTENQFRIAKGTAQTMLAHVYLQMSGYPVQSNKYAEAATAAREVIKSGKYGLIEHGATPETSAYNVMRTADNSKEYIYSYEYESSISSNPKAQICLPKIAASWNVLAYSLTNNAYRPIAEYLNVYDPAKDLRIQEKQFFHTSVTFEKDGKVVTQTFEPTPYIWYADDVLFKVAKSSKDLILYRYAEVLLIAAEAIANSEGVTAEAAGYLAAVRARAYQTTTEELAKTLTGLSKEAFIREVWTERLRELVLDMRVWSDIQRTRMYPLTSATEKGTVNFVNVIGAKNPWGKVFEEKHLLWPISDNEMQRNPALVQNPGYDK